ncbi:MAG: hypothetical protein QOH72_5101 [Solirubrobacteraceae bacterium]|nr:hypothetical protein [Solirubrobacteraceae bacterium]
MTGRDFGPVSGLQMRMRARHRISLLVAVFAAALACAGPASALTVGIADNKADMFFDPRFASSGVTHARLSVGWDALSSPWQTQQIDTWLNAARTDHVDALVSFGHSRTDRRSLPTPERFLYEFRRFRARYPWVKEYATWNEANHCGEPTCHRPALVAAYYRNLRRDCPDCRILAAEVLDMPNMVSWVHAFRRAARQEPRYWGLHNYIDANRARTTGTRRMLKAVKGQVWFTETGGIVRRTNRRKVTFPESAKHAAIATRFLFQKLVPLSRRVTRVYIYHWNADATPTTWDSALIGPTGRVRPAYAVVERVLNEQAARRAARAARRHATPPA